MFLRVFNPKFLIPQPKCPVNFTAHFRLDLWQFNSRCTSHTFLHTATCHTYTITLKPKHKQEMKSCKCVCVGARKNLHLLLLFLLSIFCTNNTLTTYLHTLYNVLCNVTSAGHGRTWSWIWKRWCCYRNRNNNNNKNKNTAEKNITLVM